MKKKFKVTVNNETYIVEIEEIKEKVKEKSSTATTSPETIEEPIQKPAEKPVEEKTSRQEPGAIKSPLPGKVTLIRVNKGRSVKKGDVLLIIEAMKMDNEILAPHDGLVGEVFVKPGDYVETGSKLLILEEG